MKKLLLFFVFVFFLVGCDSKNSVSNPVFGIVPSVVGDIKDNQSWYDDMNDSVIRMDVSIPTPNSSLCKPYDDLSALERPCTLADIDNDIDAFDDYEPSLNVIFESGGFSSVFENASFKIRGDYSRTQEQKSYAIKLFSDEILLFKERKFQLNKHQSDRSRVKNKLAFDLFRTIPDITSLKTRFVNLFIDGIDYGLFTHVEAIRKEYLVNRGWNKDDNLYNAVDFMFEPRDELATDISGAALNPDLFDTVLEIKRGNNHLKLNEMLQAIEDTTDIDKVIDRYFNRKNYLTWLAINLVLNNKDTTYHNFYLYNPLGSETFYFLPWDYDGAWSEAKYLGKNEYGISVWWESPLHRKFLSIKKNRDDLYAMAETLREKYITDEAIKERLDSYEPNIRGFMSTYPDSQNNSDSSWLEATQALITGIDYNIELYKSVIGHPMPFRERASYTDGVLTLSWDESVDLEGDEIVYDLKLARDANMSDILIEKNELNVTSYVQDINLSAGSYYLQVVSKEKDDPSHYQIAFDQTYDHGTVYGVLRFEVK